MKLFKDYQQDGKDYLTRGQLKDLLRKLFNKHNTYSMNDKKQNMDKIIDAFVKTID